MSRILRNKNESEGKIGREGTKSDVFLYSQLLYWQKNKIKQKQKQNHWGGKNPQKLRMRLGPLFAKLKSLDNVYDEMTVKIFQQDSDVIRVCPQEDFWVAVGAMGRSE